MRRKEGPGLLVEKLLGEGHKQAKSFEEVGTKPGHVTSQKLQKGLFSPQLLQHGVSLIFFGGGVIFISLLYF